MHPRYRLTTFQTYIVLVNVCFLLAVTLFSSVGRPELPWDEEPDEPPRWGGRWSLDRYTAGLFKSRTPPGLRPDCAVCVEDDTFCESLGEHNFARSILYSGTNARLYRLFDKLREGRPIIVSALGGSVTMGHGLRTADSRSGPMNMHRIVFDHLTSLFPNEGHQFTNGGQAAQGSGYFNMCFKEHIDEASDLILMEFAINDNRDVIMMEKYETLMRGLLALPSKPAVIALQTFGLLYPQLSTGGDLHLGLSSFYDIPTITLRNVVLPQIMSDRSRETTYDRGNATSTPRSHVFWFAPWGEPGNSPDIRHIGPAGHDALGRLANIYLDRTLCEMDHQREKASKNLEPVHPDYPWQFPQYDEEGELPRLMLQDHYDLDTIRAKMDPSCSSTASEKHPLTPISSEGWHHWSWKDKKYIISNTPGSTITFAFTTAIGIVELGYQRSAKYGLGMVECWVDDEKDKKQALDGYWDKDISVGQVARVGRDLSPGEHMLSCELRDDTHDPTGGKEFRIISLST